MKAAHALFAVLGAAAIGSAATMNILALPGTISHPRALAYAVLAILLIGGAAAVGVAWNTRRRGMAITLAVTIMVGEVLAIQWTSERTLQHRADAAAPRISAEASRLTVANRVAEAERALAAADTSPRLTAALAAQRAAAEAVAESASQRGCAVNCRQLLQSQVDAAAKEVDAARREIEIRKAAATTELASARAAFLALPPPQPVSALGAVLGLPAWVLDLSDATMQSVAFNVSGALLFAFGLHGLLPMHRHDRRQHIIDLPTQSVVAMPLHDTTALAFDGVLAERDANAEANAFAVATFTRPESGAERPVRLADLRGAYQSWCASRGLDPLPEPKIATAINGLFSRAGLMREGDGPDAIIVGIAWKQERLPAPELAA